MPVTAIRSALAEEIRDRAHLLTGDDESDYEPILDLIGNARFVLLGEATHGTHEFYRERAAITRILIREAGFTAVAAEADWPDMYRVNRYIRHESEDRNANEALLDFKRFPQWMWRNADVLNFVDWLYAYNAALPPEFHIGFYGLDLYSMFQSIGVVLSYLDRTDPESAKRARYRYSCFDQSGEDPQSYGYRASFGLTKSCEEEVIAQLLELRKRRLEDSTNQEFFSVEQNARLVKNAEKYYRTMFMGRVSSWNVRDSHMSEMLETLVAHLDAQGRTNKIVVWAHNSHIGNAKATYMGEAGEFNIGQLMKEKHGNDAVLIGFTTHTGTVTAADDWGEPAQIKRVNPSLEGSYERLFHETGLSKFFLRLRDGLRDGDLRYELQRPRLERAIGVIYRPETERASHYFDARLADQFDGILHFERTKAVRPLEWTAPWPEGELPETYPSAL
ncbi:MAG: erythromycin esterase-like enzyme [Candidatus Peribacteria bacterium]|nr:erythromycin esterase-like enzyme [Candidatus Peribacteria bacterium]